MDKHRGQGFMSWDLFKKVIDDMADLGNLNLGLNYGGESLLHKDFKKFLEYAIEKRDCGQINLINWVDNGMLFSHEISDLVVDLGVDSIGFSLEGFAKVNDFERIGCSYEKVKDNILYLIDKRGSNCKPEIRINSLNPSNDLDFVKFWVDRVETVRVSTVRNMDNQLINTKFFGNNWFTPKKCAFPFTYFAVFWNGLVTGCCSDGYGRMNLGDLNKQSISEVWNGQPFKDLRNGSANGLCKTCDFWKYEFIPSVETVFGGSTEITYSQYWKHYRRVPF